MRTANLTTLAAAVGALAAPTRSGRKQPPAPKGQAQTPLETKVLAVLKKKGTSFADTIADGIPTLDQFTAEEQVNTTLRALKARKLVREVAPGQWSVAR